MSEFTTADIVFLIVIGASAVLGWVRGITTELLSLVILAAALYAGLMFGSVLVDWLVDESAADVNQWFSALGFLVVFGVVYLIGGLIRRLTVKAVEKSGMSSTDHMVGLVFGGLRGVLVVLVVTIVLDPTGSGEGFVADSALLPYLNDYRDGTEELLETVRGYFTPKETTI